MASPQIRESVVIPPAVISALLVRALAHEHQIVTSLHAHAQIHPGAGRLGRFNRGLAILLTKSVGTMYCAYLFAALALVALPQAMQAGPLALVQWISQTFIQLVLLSVIMVGQNVLSQASDARAAQDHTTLTVLHEMNVTQLAILQELQGQGQGQGAGTPTVAATSTD